jgi:threonine aldolase
MNAMIADFRSDTVTRPTPAMREAMASAAVGDDVYGDDPSVNELQGQAAQRLGFAQALFVPSGTMSNLLALMSHCQRGDEVICGQSAHTYRYEAGGMAVLGSLQPQPLPNAADGTIALAAIADAIKPDDAHFARSRLIALENTIGGKVLPVPYLAAVAELARSRGLATHLDGARLMNAARAQALTSGVPTWACARSIAGYFDSLSLCLSKGLGAPVGSLLLGSVDVIGKARRLRKMVGGGMRQAGLMAAAGLHALDHHVERLAEDHRRAQLLSTGLAATFAQHPRLATMGQVGEAVTNMVFVSTDPSVDRPLKDHLASRGVLMTSSMVGGRAIQRWVLHLDVDDTQVERAIAAVKSFA